MAVLQEKDRAKLSGILANLVGDVKLVFFTQEFECQYCSVAHEMLEEIAAMSDKISLEVYDFVADAQLAEKYNVTQIPATIIEGERDFGIRFFGVPGGYEFMTLIEDIIDVSNGAPQLPQPVLDELAKIDQDVSMQVFVTPT